MLDIRDCLNGRRMLIRIGAQLWTKADSGESLLGMRRPKAGLYTQFV